MAAQRTISFRISATAVQKLDALAGEMDRDRSYLLNEAVEQYLELNRYHMSLVAEGIAAADRGDFVEHEEVRRMIGKMRRRK